MSHPDEDAPETTIDEGEVELVSETAPPAVRPRRTSAPPSPLPIVAGILVIVVGSAFALFFQRDTTDPHFARARIVLERYELGKPEEARDYGHPAYAEALTELGLVDRMSRSARPADELAADIRRRSVEQEARVRARAVEMSTHQELQQHRDEQFFRERRMRPPPSNPGAPECKEESTPAPLAGEHEHTH